jgi:3-oxo-5alpha-steroid 4-dehydrogenase
LSSSASAAPALDPDGAVIPGLYAAGRTTSGIAAYGYVSGISLADGTFFGRQAGRSAANAVSP